MGNYFTHKDFLPSASEIAGIIFTPLHIAMALCWAATPEWLSAVMVYALYLLIHALPYLPHFVKNRCRAREQPVIV